VKLRHRSPAVPAMVTATPRGFRVALDQPAYGVARGQAAVLYEDDAVVGSGIVSAADA
jgi:tRNA-uridine 2-sulfurtransferase